MEGMHLRSIPVAEVDTDLFSTSPPIFFGRPAGQVNSLSEAMVGCVLFFVVDKLDNVRTNLARRDSWSDTNISGELCRKSV